MAADEPLPVVLVRAEVNVDRLRKGDELEVELTPRTRKMISAGYLRILGHLSPPPVAAAPAPTPAEPVRLASPRRTRVAAKAPEGGGDGPASRDHPQP
jgi:hypothetical protein